MAMQCVTKLYCHSQPLISHFNDQWILVSNCQRPRVVACATSTTTLCIKECRFPLLATSSHSTRIDLFSIFYFLLCAFEHHGRHRTRPARYRQATDPLASRRRGGCQCPQAPSIKPHAFPNVSTESSARFS